jgi:squalene-hopene/tetraprenyl-beta-curcumene cyclase
MPDQIDQGRLERAYGVVRDRLLSEMSADGYWLGELSASALSTATAVSALISVDREAHAALVDAGAGWLCTHQNNDGGWGDTADSPSNVSTTLLAMSALTLHGHSDAALERARGYLDENAGRTPGEWIETLNRIYGRDRTFAVPILTNAAIAGLVQWDQVPRLPFELAAVPQGLYRFLRLHVVSYALPALIAVGLALHRNNPSRNPVARGIRNATTSTALRKLEAIQPESGGFLEATPLNSFVTMSMAAAGLSTHPVTQNCIEFIVRSARDDGSWPIDSDLSVWLTTQAVLALDAGGSLDAIDTNRTRDWLLRQQHTEIHPYTRSTPGGWPWTHRSGGVPDADDTARALLALVKLGVTDGLQSGIDWLLSLQNSDGGWPTFCRGWGKLPFDRSSPDITAHAIEALKELPHHGDYRREIARARDYLDRTQTEAHSWAPLWFGNQLAPGQHNPVFGAAHVLPVVGQGPAAARAAQFLLTAQNDDGGWGGDTRVPSSIEETATVVSAMFQTPPAAAASAQWHGVQYLVERVEAGTWDQASPIGLYFAKLWYSERLYPIIWTAEALGRAARANRA